MLGHPIPYPVRLEGRLDHGVSRWLWLVKWFLVIPHAIVLAFLWAAFFVLSLVAVVAVAFTGRYPRTIFDFNLGVLRWSWRVGFYAYSALGTDRYPPFTLDDVTDYPARLEIAYPQRLPRGLGLLKWWILALPHYLIVAMLAGGGTWIVGHADDWGAPFQGGLITLIALIAGVVLLFTGRYPRELFDLLLGFDRWVVRVGAYAARMTDAYPPFRLDLGASDGTLTVPPPAAPDEPIASTMRRDPSNAVLIALGSLMALIAVGLATAGVVVLLMSASQRDADGFLMTPGEQFSTNAYALSSERIEAHLDGPDWLYTDELLGNIRVRSRSDRPVFVGIAASADAEAYLAGISHEVVTGLDGGHDQVPHPGAAPDGAPADAGIWVASTSGTGTKQLTWRLRDGDWTLVVMNSDGSPDVASRLSVGARLQGLGWIGGGILAGGLVVGAAAAALLVGGLRRSGS